jgi:hypothetical protein
MSDFTTTLRQHSADLPAAAIVTDRDAESVYTFTLRDILKFLLHSEYRHAESINARTIFAERSHYLCFGHIEQGLETDSRMTTSADEQYPSRCKRFHHPIVTVDA